MGRVNTMFRMPYDAVYETFEELILKGKFDKLPEEDILHIVNTEDLIKPTHIIDEFMTSKTHYLCHGWSWPTIRKY